MSRIVTYIPSKRPKQKKAGSKVIKQKVVSASDQKKPRHGKQLVGEALEEPDNHLINIERLTEDELRELHARYEKLQAPEPAAPEVNIRMPRAD